MKLSRLLVLGAFLLSVGSYCPRPAAAKSSPSCCAERKAPRGCPLKKKAGKNGSCCAQERKNTDSPKIAASVLRRLLPYLAPHAPVPAEQSPRESAVAAAESAGPPGFAGPWLGARAPPR